MASDSAGDGSGAEETHSSAYYKRRSSRLVPGFTLEDDFLNASAQEKSRPLSDILLDYVPRCSLVSLFSGMKFWQQWKQWRRGKQQR